MTTDIKLLPLPEEEWNVQYGYYADAVADYARACVAAAVEAKDAEIDSLRSRLEDTVRDSTNKIEALRTELREAWSAVDSKAGWEWKKRAEQAEARAERLAEALEFQSALKKNLLPYQDEAVASRAEIEALKVEVAAQRTRADAMTGEAVKHKDRYERLTEALRGIRSF